MVEPLGVRAFLASFRLSDCTMEIELQFVAPVCVHIGIVHLYSVTHIECAGLLSELTARTATARWELSNRTKMTSKHERYSFRLMVAAPC